MKRELIAAVGVGMVIGLARTLPLRLSPFQSQFGDDRAATMAAASICAVPILALFVLLQRRAASGLTDGAVKG